MFNIFRTDLYGLKSELYFKLFGGGGKDALSDLHRLLQEIPNRANTQEIVEIKITGLNRPTTHHISSAHFFVSVPVPQQ
jgi:hypothetical protein